MHENMTILSIALVVLGYGYLSKLLYRYNISGPMVFTTVGVLLSPLFLGAEVIKIDGELVQVIAEITLIVVLFSDASAINLNRLKLEWTLPMRLLLIGLPLTIALSTFVAKEFFPSEPIPYLLLLALVLAPTDAALGKAVVSDKSVPEKIRNTINVESGLNDGIVFPILITVVAMIVAGAEHNAYDNSWIGYIFQQIFLGSLLGAAVGYVGAKISTRAIGKRWMENNYENLVPIALAIFAYYLAEHFGGNGFIAAFFSGLLLGNYNEELRGHVEDFAESEGDLLIMICFLVFGFAFIPAVVAYWDIGTLGYALLSLTILRMVPVAISLVGIKLDFATMLFIGWFGPRGIASILYLLIIVHQLGSFEDHTTLYAVSSLTILLSIFLHGLSATPLVRLFTKTHQEKT